MSEEQSSAPSNPPPSTDEDTLRIMLSTDNHLGYNERDPVRGMDSFAAFEEVLYLAKRFHCDMVLIAGDLFHDNRPSRRTLHKTMEILRRYVMGSDPVRIQILSDQTQNFQSKVVNYQDPSYAVDLPIFSIHGNHDDPSRDPGSKDLLAALDLLSVTNLVNYFGRHEDVEKIDMSPVLIQKGTTKVAMYGLGSMRDERLNRMWQSKKVRFLRPEEDESVFLNLFALHQNRDLGRGSKNCIQEVMIPEWMDVVVWGHEHECLIDFAESVVGSFRITQPGSSVATSLVSGEAVRKYVGLFDVKGEQFRLHKVPLTQVRSFVTTEVSLKEHKANLDPEGTNVDEHVTQVLDEEVKLMISNARQRMNEVLEEARAAGSDAGDENSPLKNKIEKPNEVLVRIRVECSGFSTLNNQRFGARYVGEVANPSDILLFHRRKQPGTKKAAAALKKSLVPEELERTNMEDLVNEHLEDQKLTILEGKKLNEALEEYVEKNLVATITDTTASMLKKKQKELIATNKVGDDSRNIEKASQVRKIVEDEIDTRQEREDSEKTAKKRNRVSTSRNLESEGEEMDEPGTEKDAGKENTQEDEETTNRSRREESSPKRSRTVRTAQGDAKRKAARRRQLLDDDSEEDDIQVEKAVRPPAASKTASRPKRGASKPAPRYSLDAEDDEDEFEDIEDVEDEELVLVGGGGSASKKRGRASSSRAGSSKAKSRARSGTSNRSAKASRKKLSSRLESDDDDDFDAIVDDLDDDWGTAATRSQI